MPFPGLKKSCKTNQNGSTSLNGMVTKLTPRTHVRINNQSTMIVRESYTKDSRTEYCQKEQYYHEKHDNFRESVLSFGLSAHLQESDNEPKRKTERGNNMYGRKMRSTMQNSKAHKTVIKCEVMEASNAILCTQNISNGSNCFSNQDARRRTNIPQYQGNRRLVSGNNNDQKMKNHYDKRYLLYKI